MKNKLFITLWVFLVWSTGAQASTQLLEKIKFELQDELYPVTSVVPGYQRPFISVPKFAVAEFKTSDMELKIWSQAISEILRYRIQYVPGVRLHMPAPYYTLVDAQVETEVGRTLFTGLENFRKLKKTSGIETILTGSVSKNPTAFLLDMEIIDVDSGIKNSQHSWEFSAQELSGVLIGITEWVYSSLGVELSEKELAYIRDIETLEIQAIEAFVEHYAELSDLNVPLRRDAINQLREKFPKFALLAAYALSNRAYAKDLDEAYKNIELYEKLRALNPGNAGVELESYRALDIDVMPKHEVAARITKMKKLMQENPDDASIAINLAGAIVDNGNSVEAITVLLEAVERWPQNYRAWWSLGWAVNKHAWQVRGNSFWRDVPERAKTRFKSLAILSDKILDQALKLNDRSPGLWNMKINTLGSIDGFSNEILEVFDKAVLIAPQNRSVYSSALNYSGQNWGGSVKARRHIIETAEKNNPDAVWPEVMRNRHIGDFERPERNYKMGELERYFWDLVDHPEAWKMALVLVFILLWAVYSIGKWMGRSEADSVYDESDYEETLNEYEASTIHHSSRPESRFRR